MDGYLANWKFGTVTRYSVHTVYAPYRLKLVHSTGTQIFIPDIQFYSKSSCRGETVRGGWGQTSECGPAPSFEPLLVRTLTWRFVVTMIIWYDKLHGFCIICRQNLQKLWRQLKTRLLYSTSLPTGVHHVAYLGRSLWCVLFRFVYAENFCSFAFLHTHLQYQLFLFLLPITNFF